MDADTLQDGIDAQIEQSEDAKHLGVVSITLGHGAEVVDLTSSVDVDVTVARQAPRSFIIYSRAVIDRFLEQPTTYPHGPSVPKGIFFSTEPMIIVENVTPESVFRGVLSYLDVEQSSRPSFSGKHKRWKFRRRE